MSSTAALYTLAVVLAILLGYGAAKLWFWIADRAGRHPDAIAPAPRQVFPIRDAGVTLPTRLPAPPEAKRIETESVRAWCDRLEAEGERTGRPRLIQQAKNIRQRLGVR